MLPFFRNLFQQVGFTPTQDFKPQLLENGGFDFGPLGTGAVGDDVYFRLVQNLQDSFAMTAWQMVKEGTEPFSDVLTTQAVRDDHRAHEPLHADRDARRRALQLQRRGQHHDQAAVEAGLRQHHPPDRLAQSQQPQLHDLRRREADHVERVPAAADLPGRRRHGRHREDRGDLRRRQQRRLQQPDRRLRAAVPAPHRLHARAIRSWRSRTAGSTRRSRT